MVHHEPQLFVILVTLLTSYQATYGLFTHTLNLFYDSGTHLGLMGLFLSDLWLIYLLLWTFFGGRTLSWLLQLSLSVFYPLLAESKASEEESKNRILEEAFLSLFAIFVHGVSDRLEFNICTTHQFLDLLFLKMMGKYYWKHRGCVDIVQFVLATEDVIRIVMVR
mgnify:CR=1 FL=1